MDTKQETKEVLIKIELEEPKHKRVKKQKKIYEAAINHWQTLVIDRIDGRTGDC